MANFEVNLQDQCKNDAAQSSKQTDSGKIRSRERWVLLSKAVKSKQYQMLLTNNSVNNCNADLSSLIKTYGLMDYVIAPNDCCDDNEEKWFNAQWNSLYKVDYEKSDVNLFIRFGDNRLTFEELAGFDNSGNIRLWPCEELLAYLFAYGILKDKIFGKVICELGAGMTALAGLVISALKLQKQIYLTDGNIRCVQNIEQNVNKNFSNNEQNINVQLLRWGYQEDYKQLMHKIETIICADCLFATKAHNDLLNTIDDLLIIEDNVNNENISQTFGTVFIVAPKRGNSMKQFINLVHQDKRFFLNVFENYNQIFSFCYETLQKNNGKQIDSDSYYPYLLVMRRVSSSNEK